MEPERQRSASCPCWWLDGCGLLRCQGPPSPLVGPCLASLQSGRAPRAMVYLEKLLKVLLVHTFLSDVF